MALFNGLECVCVCICVGVCNDVHSSLSARVCVCVCVLQHGEAAESLQRQTADLKLYFFARYSDKNDYCFCSLNYNLPNAAPVAVTFDGSDAPKFKVRLTVRKQQTIADRKMWKMEINYLKLCLCL